MRIAVCDDEPVICDMLKQQVYGIMKRLNEPCNVFCYTDAAGLLDTPLDFNIFLLDIQMPGLDGMELAKSLRRENTDCALIFVTALEERVYEAFEFDAVDFLCKPVEAVRLESALKRALKRLKATNSKCLFIQTLNWCKSIKINTIYYCEVINRKIYLHTQKGVIDYYCKIDELEKQLDTRFIRCHRSYLVNLDFVCEYAEGQVSLENGVQIPVSRLRHQEFITAMLQYMKRQEG